ncbi:MAG TPA: Hpt domain-containing protein [Marinobacter sp.]|nr:Hpt domain-containing protein [Marinobacter sp.]
MKNKPHLDEEALAELRDVMEGEFKLLIQTFISDSLERIASLKAALNAGDANAFCNMVHSLKGSSINIGAPRLGTICQAAEMAGKAQELNQASILLIAIETEFQIVSDRLRALLI